METVYMVKPQSGKNQSEYLRLTSGHVITNNYVYSTMNECIQDDIIIANEVHTAKLE